MINESKIGLKWLGFGKAGYKRTNTRSVVLGKEVEQALDCDIPKIDILQFDQTHTHTQNDVPHNPL